ncbi:cleavage and polyadenylation specificity factor subunit 1 [Brevipalpus obovatus]|uniref:cleavage and polyadenylation specificity factor subunit 1 n=1 Tax=Brevipalpus obovatus TaxID=246614 RepID=UPI003D9F8818
MYTFSKQIHNPTVIEHCVYCNFFNLTERNLVVAAFNEIRVYRLIGQQVEKEASSSTSSTHQDEVEEDVNYNVKLECLRTYALYSEVCCLKSVHLNGAQRDSLLISFSDAKISLVEYDPSTNDLNTLSLHYFEDEDMKEGRNQYPRSPEIRVDPEGRCAALLTYGRNITILPFRKEVGPLDDTESSIPNISNMVNAKNFESSTKSATYVDYHAVPKSAVMPSYKLNLNDKQYAQEKIHNIVDFQFLNGYYEPTLLILHEPVRTWAGRVAVRRDTCSMVTLSLNVHQRVHPIIWSTSHLPFDCYAALPIPKPIGGVMIFAVNCLIYLNQSVPPYAVSLNSIADSTSSFTKTPQKGIKISLDCGQACFISHDKLVVSLKSGELYLVTLFSDGMRSIRSFHFEKSASSVITSCLTCCEEGYLFLGSRLGNSLLLKYTEKTIDKNLRNLNTDSVMTGDDDVIPGTSPIPEVLGEQLEPCSLPTEDRSNEVEGMEVDQRADESIAGDQQEAEIQPKTEDSSDPPQEFEDKEEIDSHKIVENETQPKIEMNGDVVVNMNGVQSEDDPGDAGTSETNGEQPEEGRPSDIGDWAAGDVALMKDPDELEVYGFENDANAQLLTSFSFELCDSLINIGPCGRICMGEPAFLSEDFIDSSDPQIELVTTSGYGKNGALCVLHRTIRPQIVTTFGLPKCLDMWTVYDRPPDDGSIENGSPNTSASRFHSYLILTRYDSTTILKTEQEISEIDHSGISGHCPTVFAGNLYKNRYIIQVSPMSVRLSEGMKQIQHMQLELGSPVFSASLVDPYTVLLTRGGSIAVLSLGFDFSSSPTTSSNTSSHARLSLAKPDINSQSPHKVVTLCAYRDVSGKFITETLQSDSRESSLKTSKVNIKPDPETPEVAKISMTTTIEDEDELLYGNSSIEVALNSPESSHMVKNDVHNQNSDKMISPARIPIHEESPPTYWLFIVRDSGSLEILKLPELESVFYCKNFSLGPKVLSDDVSDSSIEASRQKISANSSVPITREILISGMGLNNSRPILYARNDVEIMIYELFPYFEDQTKNRLRIRFSRSDTTIIVREPRSVRGNISKAAYSNITNADTKNDSGPNFLDKSTMHQRLLRPFSDIAGYSGVFICGPYPHWCFMTTRGELRVHEMNIDGPVPFFASFHNINCPKGFLYFTDSDDLRIAVLPTHVTYDACWPVRRVPLRCNINFVNYHVDSKCYCVVTSVQEVYKKLVRVGGEEKDYDALERDARYPWPTADRFSIELFSPVSWGFIPGTKVTLEEWEHVTCVKNVMLNSEGTESGLKGYIALGTNYCYGEDVTNRGRIWILDIIDVVPELGLPLTRSKIKIVYCKEQKGPVTAICQIKGLLLSAVGQKIYIWQLKEASLIGVAFIDTQIYIHQAVSVKNLILVADVYKSISLLRYQEDTRTLALASRDCNSFEVFACEFLIDDGQLCFLVADGHKNLLLYSYQPEAIESYGGTRLIRRADYHLGSLVNSFFRIRCKYPGTKRHNPGRSKLSHKRHTTVFPTIDGTVNYMLPIGEKVYRRLYMLQNIMNSHLQHRGGVNPKGVHLVKFHQRTLTNPMRNVLDGDLLFRFLSLSITERAELCRKISYPPDQIIDDLQEINKLTDHF